MYAIRSYYALDAITRAALQEEISNIQRDLRKTILFVTHDVDEALKLADYIAILQAGKLIQFGEPAKLMRFPANDFVAQLRITSYNVCYTKLLRINRLLAIPKLHEGLRKSILEKSDGNPFFIEEVVRSLIDNKIVVPEEREENGVTNRYWVSVGDGSDFSIPDNLQALLSARMDQLEESIV